MILYESIMEKKELNLTEKVILSYLGNHYNRQYHEYDYLGKILDMTRQSVSRAMERLEQLGYINRYKPQYKRYYLTTLTYKTLLLIGVKTETIQDLFEKVYKKGGKKNGK